MDAIKPVPTRLYNNNEKKWSFHISDYEEVKQRVQGVTDVIIEQIMEIPDNVRKVNLCRFSI